MGGQKFIFEPDLIELPLQGGLLFVDFGESIFECVQCSRICEFADDRCALSFEVPESPLDGPAQREVSLVRVP
ncbi:MAG: hypothetical protein QNL12_07395 [Acidimicrobiia bacterium]|nr:hypothetical protein [Acidimicrobiia bacterium]MDX2467120.1 hypothetical protein [Acidimicrobiia bacterium]